MFVGMQLLPLFSVQLEPKYTLIIKTNFRDMRVNRFIQETEGASTGFVCNSKLI